jgi:hypothetical protein
MQFDKDPENNPHGINPGQRVQAPNGLQGTVDDVYFATETDSMAASPNGPLPNMGQVSWDDGSQDYDVPLSSLRPVAPSARP